ncbi:hypothetical protein AKJ09_00515 [Labilithrix luteola]|uniref:Uncharacterized protein n=1 Tax=Labilithrix luteola TaxID=1391654 RepID=A0A0K1PKD4_9BACT|nr:hypothetical protein [Labilithrix luteola]AKU93851.1 hypothetical protein AKJ09_00515 [Labilithrix luteola]
MNDDIDNYLETLFETARSDGASRMATSERRVLDAIAASSTLATGSLSAMRSSWMKGSLFGAIVVGLAVVAFRLTGGNATKTTDAMVSAATPAPFAASGEPSPHAVNDSPPEIPSIAVDQLPSSQVPSKPNRPRSVPAPSAEPTTASTRSSLEAATAPEAASPRPLNSIAEQIRLVDSARRHVAAHEGREALAVLDDYARRFPGGALDEEATALRVEALDRAGDHAAAVALGRRFMSANPNSAYASRVALVIAKSPPHD